MMRKAHVIGSLLGLLVTAGLSAQVSLSGWALMGANTFSVGPTSGQFAKGAGGNELPLVSKQPVQGFSAILGGPAAGTYYVMCDNGFGAQDNSADTLLRVYALRIDWDAKTVGPVDFSTGKPLESFSEASFITLRDTDKRLSFPIQAEYPHYYNDAAKTEVAREIREGRLLTGADFDIESMRIDAAGKFWFGDEFGPYLVKTDRTGKVLRAEISLPGIKSPQNPGLAGTEANLPRSGGFEGMALSKKGDRLLTLLEGTVKGDPEKSLRINEFDLKKEAYTGKQRLYRLDPAGTNIGDMTAVNDTQYLVIERNNSTATSGQAFKRIFLIDLEKTDKSGFVKKTLLVDLMNIADPRDLNGDKSALFTFPYVTIEDVIVLDRTTILVVNDNNYPGTGGRSAESDPTEFLKLTLDVPLNL